MIYTFWNNKGGTGKTSLCFQTITEYAIFHPEKKILCINAWWIIRKWRTKTYTNLG